MDINYRLSVKFSLAAVIIIGVLFIAIVQGFLLYYQKDLVVAAKILQSN
ncbi:hypothetical protein KKG36_01415 [Patescibacteria group bacterium]|nr:hypothetical protein [Patescibacteria group bacterium]